MTVIAIFMLFFLFCSSEFSSSGLEIFFKDTRYRTIAVDDLLQNRNSFVHFVLRFSRGYGSIQPDGPLPSIKWNSGDEEFRVRGLAFDSSCQRSKFVFEPRPWGPIEVFGGKHLFGIRDWWFCFCFPVRNPVFS